MMTMPTASRLLIDGGGGLLPAPGLPVPAGVGVPPALGVGEAAAGVVELLAPPIDGGGLGGTTRMVAIMPESSCCRIWQ